MQVISEGTLKKLYFEMLRIRMISEEIAQLYAEQEMKCPAHFSIGQEAIAVGVAAHLKKDDWTFASHRSHAHYLAKGGGLKEMLAEIYCKKTGCGKGRGGSQHLTAYEAGMIAASAIVGGTIPIAVGAAMGFKMRGENRIAVVFFGDSACEEGVFYESLNFSALKKLPIIFVCENNFYATQSHISARQAIPTNIYRRGEIFGIPGFKLDGNDVIDIYLQAGEAIKKARFGDGPALLECATYRWLEHVGPNDDTCLGYRSRDEVEAWKKKCPVKKAEELLKYKCLTGQSPEIDKEMLKLADEIHVKKIIIQQEIRDAVDFAKQSFLPNKEDLISDVY
jgi:pyruvate dehydrogenase E1 component alpha subunit